MMLTRRTFLASSVALALPRLARADDPPVTGVARPALKPFDELMTKFVAENAVPGAALAVTRHGKLVYARGFGYADREKKLPVQPTSLFRIASVSKPVTAAAVTRLVERRKVKLDDPVLKHVKLEPHIDKKTELDPRWQKVTVRQCLQHTGGWDREKKGGFDPIGIPWKIARALKIDTPVPPEAVVRYMMGRPLDFDPGARYAYSNLGYLLLGRVIEAVTGEKYETHVKKEVLAPVGVKDMALGRALPENRFRNEVKYYERSGEKADCLYPPRVGQKVPWPDGGENFEAFEAHGGWVASAPDLLRFAAAFDDPKRSPILKAESIKATFARPDGPAGHTPGGKDRGRYYGCGWQVVTVSGGINTWHTGYIAGVNSILVRRFDGLSWAVLFNADRAADSKESLTGLIDPKMHEAADAVTKWPEVDLFGKLPS
jgi:N-acyl-D-amino-acid deacylase